MSASKSDRMLERMPHRMSEYMSDGMSVGGDHSKKFEITEARI
jgi:hypothetical protein